MKVLIPIKRVPDYQAKIRVKADGSGIETEGLKWIVNPFDEIAVEEAIRLKEKGVITEIVVATVGPDDAQTQLRYALAMGADRGILVKYSGAIDSNLASLVMEALAKKEAPAFIIMGKQAIDSDASQTGPLLAARLNWPQACFASKLQLDTSAATVTREVDGGLETIRIPLPCVVTTDLRLNEPRYASLPGIMKAKKKQLDEIAFETLGISADLAVRVIRMSPPPRRSAGKKVESVEALVQALQHEAKVL